MPGKIVLQKLKQPDNNTGTWYFIVDNSFHYWGATKGKWVREKPTDPKFEIFAIRVFPNRKHPFIGLHARTPHNPIKFNQTYLKHRIHLDKRTRRIIEKYG